MIIAMQFHLRSFFAAIAPTPNIDKIAGEGAILKNAFAQTQYVVQAEHLS